MCEVVSEKIWWQTIHETERLHRADYVCGWRLISITNNTNTYNTGQQSFNHSISAPTACAAMPVPDPPCSTLLPMPLCATLSLLEPCKSINQSPFLSRNETHMYCKPLVFWFPCKRQYIMKVWTFNLLGLKVQAPLMPHSNPCLSVGMSVCLQC